jgi:hypothetical protein
MPSKEFEHIAIEHMAAMPELLRLAMTGLSEEQTVRKPASDRWSVAEILEHLSHVEAHYFRAALDTLLCGDDAIMEPYDQRIYDAQGTYSNRDPEESFAHFEEQRETNLETLRGLDAEALKRTARHPELGTVTLEDLIHEWAMHDFGHVKQVLELVRALVHYPKLGAFQPQYKVAP